MAVRRFSASRSPTQPLINGALSEFHPRATSGLPTTHQKINKLICSVERPVPFLYAVELWSLRLLHERQYHFCWFTYWVVKSRRGRTQFVFRFRFLFSASSPSYWEPCWQWHWRFAWPIGPCDCPPSCWWSSLCWIAQRFQASEVAWKWTFRSCQFSKILAETV